MFEIREETKVPEREIYYQGESVSFIIYHLYYDDREIGKFPMGRLKLDDLKKFKNLLNKLYNKGLSRGERFFAYKELCNPENRIKVSLEHSEYKREGHHNEFGLTSLFEVLKPKMLEPFSKVTEYYTNEFIKAIPLKELLL